MGSHAADVLLERVDALAPFQQFGVLERVDHLVADVLLEYSFYDLVSVFSKMSISHVFSLIGDSNVRRHMTRLNRRASPQMEEAQVVLCTSMSTLSDSMVSVRDSSNVVIFSCLSNFLADADGSDATSVAVRVEPVLEDFQASLSTVRFNLVLTIFNFNLISY